MTRFLSILLIALPLALTAGCEGCNPNPDDDTSGDDDSGDPGNNGPSLTLVVNANAPITVDNCRIDGLVEASTENSDNCSGSHTVDTYYRSIDAEVELEDQFAVFGTYRIVIEHTPDDLSIEVIDHSDELDDPVPTIDEADNGDITVTFDLDWSGYASWCYAPEGTYEDEATGFDFDTQTYIVDGQCVMTNACAGDDVVVDIDTFDHETDGGLVCNGTISEDITQIESHWDNGEDIYNLLFIRQ